MIITYSNDKFKKYQILIEIYKLGGNWYVISNFQCHNFFLQYLQPFNDAPPRL